MEGVWRVSETCLEGIWKVCVSVSPFPVHLCVPPLVFQYPPPCFSVVN